MDAGGLGDDILMSYFEASDSRRSRRHPRLRGFEASRHSAPATTSTRAPASLALSALLKPRNSRFGSSSNPSIMVPLARLLAVLYFCCWERVHSDSTRPSSLAPPTHHYNSSNSSSNCRIVASSTSPALGSHRRRSSSRRSDRIAENQLRYSVDYEYDLDSITSIDTALRPDFWSDLAEIDARIPTNGEPPEQLVKVTDRRHRHPVFATICSLAFLLTIISIIVVCTH